MKYSEPDMIEAIDRLVRVYLETHEQDREALELFLRWAYQQYGYRRGQS
jgi:hypothetical protein